MSMFFTSRKTGFKSLLNTSSIPCCLSSFFSFFLSHSRQLLDTWWIDRECFYLLDSFSTPTGSIKILIWYLMICSLIPISVDDHFLNTFLDRCLDTSRHLYLSRFTATLFKLPVRSGTHFAWSLSRYFSVFLSQALSSQSNNCSSRLLQAFSSFFSLGKLLILSHSCISCLET